MLVVYFVHSTRPKIQGLVSRDSIVDHQFVTAWAVEWFMCCAVPSTVVQRRIKFGEVACTECTGQWNDFELISTVKIENRLLVEGSFGNKFASIYNHCGAISAGGRKKLPKFSFFNVFGEKRLLTG